MELSDIEGHIDKVERSEVSGWLRSARQTESRTAELWIDGEKVASTIADLFREDLLDAGKRDGSAGFIIKVPTSFCDLKFHELKVRDSETMRELPGVPDKIQLIPPLNAEEFYAGYTFIDGPDDSFEQSLEALGRDGYTRDEIQLFRDFRRDGFVMLKNAVPDDVIDKVLLDVERAWQERPYMLAQSEGEDPRTIASINDEKEYRSRSARYLDFHNLSNAAAEILCNLRVQRFVEGYLGAPLAGMQSLLFENGTQQRAHQDFPYVHSLRPAALAGAWTALEDVSIDAGPLFYYPGSHSEVPLYTFSNGSVLAEGAGQHISAFEDYLENQCQKLKLEKKLFTAKRGDVLIWHSALVHGGSRRNNPKLSRKSFVCHYTTQQAYPIDRRTPSKPPTIMSQNGLRYYKNEHEDHVEGLFN